MRTGRMLALAAVGPLVASVIMLLVVAGCPQETATFGAGAGATAAASGAADTATEDGSGGSGDATEPPSAPATGDMGTLIVDALDNAENRYFDVYELPGEQSLMTYQAADEGLSLAPGLYRITQYFNAAFHYADGVQIIAGQTTTVTLGAIKLVTLDGATGEYFDIWDPTGQTNYASYNAPNVLITAPAGTFVLREYFNASFDYATNVVVTEGEVTTVEMGAIRLVTVEDAGYGEYAIWSEDGGSVYAAYKSPNELVTAPPGVFTLKQYFNPAFTYASDVVVQAGEVTTVTMGAIRYNGTMDYDIYLDGDLVRSYNVAGTTVTVPPGTYLLTKYFDDETVIATHVVVTAGAVTEVP